MRRLTPEQAREQQAETARQTAKDREEAARTMASPGGAALVRYLERSWGRKGLGATPERTAYRLGLRDALEVLKDIRQEGEHA